MNSDSATSNPRRSDGDSPLHRPGVDASSAATPPSPPATLLGLGAVLVGRLRFIILCSIGLGAIAAVVSLRLKPQYRASARFASEERAGVPTSVGFAAIASQLGAGTLGGMRSLYFYADVLTSRPLLEALAQDSFPDPANRASKRPLVELLESQGDTPEQRLDAAVNTLRNRAVAVSVNDRTAIVTMEVLLPDPVLAADVATQMYRRLEQFNYSTRRSAASERRRFAERELASARAEVRDAEEQLRQFLEANRSGLTTPRLSFQRDRIQRRIDLLQEVYVSMAREVQESKIAEVRDTPVFTLIQTATPPLKKAYPRRTRMVLLAMLFGGTMAVVWIILGQSASSARALDPAGYSALQQALRTRGSSVKRPASFR